MLGMMMDFLRDSIDPVFAKGMLTIYNSTTSVIMGIAAVVAIAQLFQENKDSENDKEEEKPLKRCAGELFLVVAIIFFCYGEYCKLHYYEVPNINFYDSYEKVENEISAPGSIADIVYDEAANQRENEDVEESDGEFKVYGINYVPGSLIYHRMGEKVDIILYVTWDKGRKPIPKAEKLDFEFDREKIQPCAEDKFKITASPFLITSVAIRKHTDKSIPAFRIAPSIPTQLLNLCSLIALSTPSIVSKATAISKIFTNELLDSNVIILSIISILPF